MSADNDAWSSAPDGRLPRVLAHTEIPVDETISPAERMDVRDVPGYLGVGESALKAIRLAQVAGRVHRPKRILDYACGHGRVLRWLRAAFPDAEITAADILRDGVDFCGRQFDATGVYVDGVPDGDQFAGRFDLIWVGSLLTHLDSRRWVEMFAALQSLLAADGLLVVTTHGPLVAERLRSVDHYGYQADVVAAACADYDNAGFGFMLAEPNGYGFSVCMPAWVLGQAAHFADLRAVMYTEALWANHQDVAAFVARPVDVNWPLRPYT